MFVIGLIGLVSILLKRYGPEKVLFAMNRMKANTERRLSVAEVLPIDAKRKLMIIRRDDTEHLIILGHEKETVIESGIKKPVGKKKK